MNGEIARRKVLAGLGGTALSSTIGRRSAHAQQTVTRLGWLTVSAGSSPIEEAFRQGLRDLGHEEGRNLILEYRNAGKQPDRLPELAGELIAAKVNVIFSGGSQATRAVQQKTATIPIVMTSTNPVGLGIVKSLARPGGNITGVSIFGPEVSGKRLELLREMIPGIAKIAAVWNPDDPSARFSLQETLTAAGPMGLTLKVLEARAVDDFAAVMAAASDAGAQAIVLLPAPLLSRNAAEIAGLALQRRLPTLFYTAEAVKDGALVSYGASLSAIYRRAAYYVDRIVKGAKPADLPVEQPTKFDLAINLKTAKSLHLEVPAKLLALADLVVE